jgi:hypothetical protein
MATSGILNPQAQNHDRQNPFVMQSQHGDHDGSTEQAAAQQSNDPGGDDAMDTTPDPSPNNAPSEIPPAQQTTSPTSPQPETQPHPTESQNTGSTSVPPPAEENTETEGSSDEDDEDEGDGYTWQEMQEDKSVPDEQELKDLESRTEHSALDGQFEVLNTGWF